MPLKPLDGTADGRHFAVEVMEVVEGFFTASGNEDARRDEREDVNKMREEVAMMIVFF